jgi:hypothetical protein
MQFAHKEKPWSEARYNEQSHKDGHSQSQYHSDSVAVSYTGGKNCTDLKPAQSLACPFAYQTIVENRFE